MVVGARPQFVKAAPLSSAITGAGHDLFLIHTGQHYDEEMSARFFEDLGIRSPDVDLGVGSPGRREQVGLITSGLERVFDERRFDRVVVLGDTNSTLGGALAATRAGLPLAHVEAGLRSGNRKMPEERNRILVDHLSSLLLCPNDRSARTLAVEGITADVQIVGDVMRDALERALSLPDPGVAARLGLEAGSYVALTVHRPENADDPGRLADILRGVSSAGMTAVFPAHPRTRLTAAGIEIPEGVRLVDPLGYLEMISLQRSARVVATDSGGVQKEAGWLGIPCVTLRDETEWDETVESGWNVLAGSDPERIAEALRAARPPAGGRAAYDGAASERSAELIGRTRAPTP
jgi:UDP-N-acetylglucosamine 2-epimerase